MEPTDAPVDSAPAAAPSAPAAPADPVVTEPAAPANGDKPADPAPTADPQPKEGAPTADPATPDKPADAPAEGDDPAQPSDTPADAPAENENQTPDFKSMTRAERAQYFQNLEATTRREVEAKVNEVYQPQGVDDLKQKYIDAGHTEFEAAMLAREEVRDQEADISRARAERAELNATLAADAMEVLGTIDWLNPAKKGSFDQVSSDAATQLYDELCLTRDENTAEYDDKGNMIPGTGQIIGASMTPKQFYGLVDKIRSSGLENAKLSAQKAAEEQLAAVAPPSSNSNKTEKAFDQLSTAEKRSRLLAQGKLIT